MTKPARFGGGGAAGGAPAALKDGAELGPPLTFLTRGPRGSADGAAGLRFGAATARNSASPSSLM